MEKKSKKTGIKTCCPKCGSREFITNMTLFMLNVPVVLKADGTYKYDDSKGESEGWDVMDEPELTCAKCRCEVRAEVEEEDSAKGEQRISLVAI